MKLFLFCTNESDVIKKIVLAINTKIKNNSNDDKIIIKTEGSKYFFFRFF